MMQHTAPIYAGSLLDRRSERRKDDEWIAAQRSGDKRTVAIWRDKFLLQSDAPCVANFSAEPDAFPWVYLGHQADERPVFAVDLSALDDVAVMTPTGTEFVDLRSVWTTLPHDDAAIVAHARGMLGWRAKHLFCGRCGGACVATEAGHVMNCSSCSTHHFPRTDPAVIMLVTDGERVLLARNKRVGTKKIYSVLAGFLEPGETLEEAVVREVREESGIEVDRVTYHSSQPWPFPSSLMIGFTAFTSAAVEPTIDLHELQDGRWFSKQELVSPEGFSLPAADSIARRMLNDWISQRG
jgi:NAD+ diphosphatase